MPPAGKVRAVATFAAEVGGAERLVHVSEVFAATDPVAKARPELFEAEQPKASRAKASSRTRRR
jgi:hypothetical protein